MNFVNKAHYNNQIIYKNFSKSIKKQAYVHVYLLERYIYISLSVYLTGSPEWNVHVYPKTESRALPILLTCVSVLVSGVVQNTRLCLNSFA